MKNDSIAYVLGFMLAVSVLFGTAVSLVHHGTKDMLARNEQMHRNRTVAQAFGLEVEGRDAADYEQAVAEHVHETMLKADGRTWPVFQHPRPESGQKPDAVGFEFMGQGVWDVIRGILVLTPELDRILSLRLLEQHETPGLGGRIEEDWFLQQFQNIIPNWDSPKDRRVIIGQSLDPEAENRVDAITGATQTSQALMRMLNQELEAFRKAFMAYQAQAARQDNG
ncbi:MAG TPA: FMN-binding protein [Desulfonatronum sp.]|nr:FMN-binding protein [Desulfonatronum sp.]